MMAIPTVTPEKIVEALGNMSRWQLWRMRSGKVYLLETQETPHGPLELYLAWCRNHGYVVTVDTTLYRGHPEFRCPRCDRAFFAREARATAFRAPVAR
jgi:hypothetical protein